MANIFSKVKNDLPASLVVFLVALPLCLGVALASGAPLLSGVLSGIVGGIVVGILSGSHTSVSGPAAGLAAVVLSAIATLGHFEVFLLALVIAGALQLLAGFAKTGFIANYIPSNVIKGLLAAIGIILILKQIPHAVGFDSDIEGDFTFMQNDGSNTFSELLKVFSFFSLGAIVISALSLFVMIFWDKTFMKNVTFFPASLFVVLLGIGLNTLFNLYAPTLAIQPSHLVSIPAFNGLSSLITLPDFSSIGNYHVWIAAVTIAIVASLETLLNLEAVENIDPLKRQASPNRELIAQGVGNMVSGLIGGLPITSVIVRSSVNINSGAKTKLSAILHGVLLLLSVILIAGVLNLIPLASLAIILIVTGYKLTKVSLFKDMYKNGWNQFIPFIVTVVAIIFTDLLIGIIIGLAISVFYLLKSNYQKPFVTEKQDLHIGETYTIQLSDQVSFLNKASIKDALWNLPENSNVTIDASHSDYVDYDVLEIMEDFKTVSTEKNIKLNIVGLKEKYQLDDHIQFAYALDKGGQQKLTFAEIIQILKAGNERFVQGKSSTKFLTHQVMATAGTQSPMAVVLSCIDSRISTELIFDASLGDIISIRIAGNIISKEIIGSIELACEEIGTKVVVVLGHSNCGAVATAIHNAASGSVFSITDKIEKSIAACDCAREEITNNRDCFNKVIKANTQNSFSEILAGSNYLQQHINEQKISMVSAFYDTTTGKVTFD